MPATQVALFRGLNLGTANRVAMADLRGLLTDLGFRDVRTVLNSGNALFSGDGTAPAAAGRRIEKALLSRLGIRSRVLVLSDRDVTAVVEGNTIAQLATDPSRFFVSFLYDPGDATRVKALEERDWSPEVLAVGRRAIYQWCPAGLMESSLAPAVGKLLDDATTVRNWRTVTRLHALAAVT